MLLWRHRRLVPPGRLLFLQLFLDELEVAVLLHHGRRPDGVHPQVAEHVVLHQHLLAGGVGAQGQAAGEAGLSLDW